jgi:ribosomal protein S18 acetylase RimI-like enzyme
MISGLRIERATLDRIDDAGPLFEEMVEHHRRVAGDAFPVRMAGNAWQRRRQEYEHWLREGRATMLLARLDGDPAAVGYAVVSTPASGATWDIGDTVGELESLAVAERARGRGVGSALIEAARDVCRQAGVTSWQVAVVAANIDAIRLYERYGFRRFYELMLAPL